MRIRVLAVTALLICASFPAGAENAPAGAPEDGAAAAPRILSTTPKQSLERLPADSTMEKVSEGRFSFYRVDGGFLRFDSQSGQIAFCNSHNSAWACEAVPEARAALEKQVEQLRAEVDALQQKLKMQDDPPRPPRPILPQTTPPAEAPPVPGNGRDLTSLPGQEQISRAVAAAQEAWRHFVELVIGFKNDVLRRS